MKLRTVLNELPLTASYLENDKLLDYDVVVSPEWRRSSEGIICLGSLTDYLEVGAPQEGEGLLLVYVQGKVAERFRKPPASVIFGSGELSPSDFQDEFMHLVSKSGELAVRREKLFNAYLSSYDLKQFGCRAAEVIGNPVVISNTDRKVLAFAGELPLDRSDIAQVLDGGYITQEVEDSLAADGVLTSVRNARHSVIAMNERDNLRCVTSIIYRHRLEMGRFDVFETTHPVTPRDLELIDYATSLAGLMIDRLDVAGERVGKGSTILSDILSGKLADEDSVRAHLMMAEVPLDSSYVVMRIAGQSGAGRDYYTRVGRRAGSTLPKSLWCIIDDAVAVLLPMPGPESGGLDGYEACARRIVRNRRFTDILENNDMRAYVGEPFLDMVDARNRYRQCQLLEKAQQAQKMDEGNAPRIVFFWERRFQVVASVFKDHDSADMLLDKRVVAMADHDAEHGSSYLETAVMSVRFPGSPAEAAEALNVHRNTYFYRVNKIRELFGLDLKDGDDRLALAFTARIIESIGTRP